MGKLQRVGVVQTVTCWIDAPAELRTTDEVCAWMEENDGWPDVLDGEWETEEFLFPGPVPEPEPTAAFQQVPTEALRRWRIVCGSCGSRGSPSDERTYLEAIIATAIVCPAGGGHVCVPNAKADCYLEEVRA